MSFKNILDFIKSLFLILSLIFSIIIIMVVGIFIFNGKIYIELIIILVIIYIFIFWKIWFKQSKKKLIKNYNPEKDMGRLAEEEKKLENIFEEKQKEINNGKTKPKNGGTEPGDSTTATADTSSVGLGKSKERELLPKTTVDNVRKNSSGTRKNSSGIRRLLRRRK